MKGWSLKNYHSYLREQRKSGATLPEARALYRAHRDQLGRPVFKADIKRAPLAPVQARTAPSGRAVRGGGGGGPVVSATIDSLDQFYEYWEQDADYGFDEYESSLDYEEDPS